MQILPAIDLKDGRCVRLYRGDFATVHTVADSAADTARRFLAEGASMLHMVDLDGAKTGGGLNRTLVGGVISQTGAAVELGGGIRSLADVEEVLALGVARAVIGSAAVSDPDFVARAVARWGDRIAVGIDALDGTVRTEGWLRDEGLPYLDFARSMEALGVSTIIFTDISRDGLQKGPSLEALSLLRQALSCRLIASGGVTILDDIRALRDLGADAAIVGKAAYTGALNLAEAIKIASTYNL